MASTLPETIYVDVRNYLGASLGVQAVPTAFCASALRNIAETLPNAMTMFGIPGVGIISTVVRDREVIGFKHLCHGQFTTHSIIDMDEEILANLIDMDEEILANLIAMLSK